ncbi:MAG: peptidyl-prolyl cis-trans isomerase [Bdellovibrio sp.]|nr:peptidyl-prolyl cis-trans isomerase [Bdellovibrio sp.]
MKILFGFLLIILCTLVHAKILDKIMAVVDDQTISMLDVMRIKDTLRARNEISPQIFPKTSLTDKEIMNILINKKLIREKLNALGYVIADDQVESQIKSTEDRLGLNRDALLNFLRTNGLEFEEYFEVTRESIEYNIFLSRVISPMISVTEQEIKNEFYKTNPTNSTLGHRFDLVDFYIPKGILKPSEMSQLPRVLKGLQKGESLRGNFGKFDATNINNINEDGLSKEIKGQLEKLNTGDFSSPITIGNKIHVFFVKHKELVDSDKFLKQKEILRQKIYAESEKQMTEMWFQRESSKHFIKFF